MKEGITVKNTGYDWDLSKIFKNFNEVDKSILKTKKLVKKLVGFKGKIKSLNSDSFFSFLELNEEISLNLEKIYIYSYLYYYENTLNNDGQKLIYNAEMLHEFVSSKISFVIPELLNIDYEKMFELLNSTEKLKKYIHEFEELYRRKKHTLSEKEEQILSNASLILGTPESVFSSLNNSDIKFDDIEDENGNKIELTISKYSKLMDSNNRNIRINAFNSLYKYYSEHINTISSLFIGHIKENFFISLTRKYSSPLEASLYEDNIDKSLFDKLIKITSKNINLLNKYLLVKKEFLNIDQMHMYDLYVNPIKIKEKNIKYEECINIINNSLKPLGEDYLDKLNLLYRNNCVSVYPKKGKRSGAYEWATYGIDPFISLEYENNLNSVSTLIHESGHAMHTFYSNKCQSYTYANYPIFLAEIASTVNEILLNEYLYSKSKSIKEKEYYLMDFLDTFRATVFRQVMFSEFESIIHDKYLSNESITKDVLCEKYFSLNKKYYGVVINDELIKYEWARIPHFYTSFYVYKYATGFIVSLIIVDRLLNEKGFQEKYIKFLSSGGSDYPLNILNQLGIDITDDAIINKAFDVFGKKIDDLSKLLKE